MRRSRLVTSSLVGLCLLVLTSLAPQPLVAVAEAQTPAPGTARVWFLRPAGSLNGNVWAAAPMIYAMVHRSVIFRQEANFIAISGREPTGL
jgi:hypothetical protein